MTSLSQHPEPAARTVPLDQNFSTTKRIAIPQDNQDLNDEITRLAGHINAAQYRFLKLLAALVERNAWDGGSGIKSPAHWLNYYCGIALGAAREKVRVALCLNSLPLIDRAFQCGEISYSKVRAMTRSATLENEEFLLGIAKHGTAEQLESLIRKHQRVKRLNSEGEEKKQGHEGQGKRQHLAREFSSYYDDDGMLVFKGKLAAEEGAVFMAALEAAFAQIEARSIEAKSVPAGTSFATDKERASGEKGGEKKVDASKAEGRGEGEGRAAQWEEKESCTQKRADALLLMAEHSLLAARDGSGKTLSSGDKYQVVVHLDVKAQQGAEAGISSHAWLEGGPVVCAETFRRLACDASLHTVLEDSEGKVLNVGRNTRTVPPAIRKALIVRDRGCRAPGCCQTRYVDAHHIRHWCDGGETSLDNLVLLCRYHHRLLHQGAFSIQNKQDGAGEERKRERGREGEREIVFVRADGRVIPESLYPQFDRVEVGAEGLLEIESQNQAFGLDIDAGTAITNWMGESLDYGLAIGALNRH